MKITNQFTPVSPDKPQWRKDEDGFLRCTARVLMEKVMLYANSEVDGIPDGVGSDQVKMYVPMSEMCDVEAIKSLEGSPIVAGDHTWMTPELIAEYGMGSVAGTPVVDGPYLVCDLMVTNPDAIKAIESGQLTEISSAYRADTDFTQGEFNGESYDGSQRSLRFNHIAVIPSGCGRAGADVRILNKKTNQEDRNIMTEEKKIVRVKLKNTGKYVNTDEEGASALEDEGKATEKTGSDLESKMGELDDKNSQMADLQAEVDTLKGELSQYKETLDKLLSEEAVEGKADEMLEEQDEAGDIIENAMPEDEKEPKKKEEFKNSLRKVHGSKLHVAVLNAIGVKTENMSPEAIKGAFKAQHQICNAMKGRVTPKVVAGHTMIQNATGKVQNMAEVRANKSHTLGYRTK